MHIHSAEQLLSLHTFFLVPDATESKLSTGAIVGIVLAAIILTLLAGVLVPLFISK